MRLKIFLTVTLVWVALGFSFVIKNVQEPVKAEVAIGQLEDDNTAYSVARRAAVGNDYYKFPYVILGVCCLFIWYKDAKKLIKEVL